MSDVVQAEQRLVRAGVLAGALSAVTYVASKVLPLPAPLERAIFVTSGPLLVVTILGIYPFLRRPRASASAIVGTVFGVVTGVCRMLFVVVQEANVERFGRIAVAQDPASQQLWRDVRGSVFSVQSGINYVFDFFGDTTGYLFAIAMWRHPRFGKPFSVAAVILVTPHFVMKALTFPVPPSSAGLFDAGPLVMLFLAAVVVQIGRNLSWVDGWDDEAAHPAREGATTPLA